jgi:hypothetical protein
MRTFTSDNVRAERVHPIVLSNISREARKRGMRNVHAGDKAASPLVEAVEGLTRANFN